MTNPDSPAAPVPPLTAIRQVMRTLDFAAASIQALPNPHRVEPLGLSAPCGCCVCKALTVARDACDAAGMFLAKAEGERDALTAETEKLEAEHADGPPGQWICRTCGFRLSKMVLRASDMAVGIDDRVVEDICPNEGSSMRRVTWKEDALASDRVGIEQMKRADKAESQRDDLAQAVRAALIELDWQPLPQTAGIIRQKHAEDLRDRIAELRALIDPPQETT